MSRNSTEAASLPSRLRGTVIVAEEATDPLTTTNRSTRWLRVDAVNERVAQALMVPLLVIMRHEFGDRLSEMPFAERDHAVETLFPHGAHKALRMRVAVRRTDRRPDHADAC